jgi:hypothetical protein
MSTQPIRDWQEDPEGPVPAWEWPRADRPPLPVMGRSELFITEESAAQVANTFRSTDADENNRILDIESRAPTVDPKEKWQGDGTSDSVAPKKPDRGGA